MKKLIALLLALLLLTTALTGCGETAAAESAVKNMFEALQEVDLDEAQKYVKVEDITTIDEDSDEEESLIFVKKIFENVEYEILSSEKIDENTVIVKTKITAIDMKPVMGEFFSQYFAYVLASAFTNPQPSDEEMTKKMEELFNSCMSEPDLEKTTSEVDIKVAKASDGSWKVEADDVFTDALLGGLKTAMEELSDSFN